MREPNQIMIDIETIDITARAVVISLGAVAFTFERGAQAQPFFRALKYDDQLRLGRRVSDSTLSFWSKQTDGAREAAFRGFKVDTMEALHELDDWLKTRTHEGSLVWAYPAAFDLAILEDLYTDFGMTIPWSHRTKRCARTLAHLAGNPQYDEPPSLIPHHPVSDCHNQIAQAQEAVRTINTAGINMS